jgi:hypothetical protein
MKMVWNEDTWHKNAVQEAMAKTFDFEVIYNAEQIDGKDKGKTFFMRDTMTIAAPKVEIECGNTKRRVGDVITCNVSLVDPLRILQLTGVKVNFQVSGQESVGDGVAFADIEPSQGRHANKFVYTGLSFPITIGAKHFVGVIATISSNELTPISGTAQIEVKGRGKSRFGRRSHRVRRNRQN